MGTVAPAMQPLRHVVRNLHRRRADPADAALADPGADALWLSLLAFAIVLPIAFLSWIGVEKPALRLRRTVVGLLKKRQPAVALPGSAARNLSSAFARSFTKLQTAPRKSLSPRRHPCFVNKALTGREVGMLRRYLIVNGTTTLLLYGVFLAFAPSAPHLLQSVRATFETFSMESPMLRPLFHRIVLVSGALADR